MGVHVAGDAPTADRLAADAVKGIGAEVDSLRVPRLQGVVLGGGYGRGEGGVWVREEGTGKREEGRGKREQGTGKREEGLYNDLDFFAVTDEGASDADIAAIAAALAPVAERWSGRLGIDVDFTVRTPWRLRHDRERLMVQELLHGYFDVAGRKGADMFAGIEVRPPSALPWTEAVRLLVNRGMGLLLAKEEGRGKKEEAGKREQGRGNREDDGFIVRNVNKCVLGAGDARLIARGGHLWKAEDRAKALGDSLYAAALGWKFRPRRDGVCGWDEAQAEWLGAVDEVMSAGRRLGGLRRTVYQAARWVWRRRALGSLATFGYGPVVRILFELEPVVRRRGPLPQTLRRDWEIFN